MVKNKVQMDRALDLFGQQDFITIFHYFNSKKDDNNYKKNGKTYIYKDWFFEPFCILIKWVLLRREHT